MNTYKNNPNQKTIKITKENCDKHNKYTMINLDALQMAMRDLTNAQFKVWLFLAKNADGYDLELSPAEAAYYWGIKKNTMQETIRLFTKRGYLIPVNGSHTYFEFHEIPITVDKEL